MQNQKLWSGRFSEPTEKIVEEFNASISFDKRMALFDIKGSIAHAEMLGKQKIITQEESALLIKGLEQIYEEIINNSFDFNTYDEDVHMAIEQRLTSIVGSIGGKLHTARSRNDQVALDFKLYLRDYTENIMRSIILLMNTIYSKADENKNVIMPGYTHLQTAQPIYFSHYIMSYFQMLKRDYERFDEIRNRMNYCPLGAGALAGTTFPIDRHFTSDKLGFRGPTENSIDSVSDRDFALEFLAASSICIMHLSRLSEEIIVFSTSEFSFLTLSDGFCTGSSIMPQKKNPDIPELVRGKTGRIYGSLMGLLTTMKGIPLAYNKDMQEDKEGVFDAADTLFNSIKIFTEMLKKIALNKEKMISAAIKGYSTATDLADYLVKKGLPFRQAHHAAGQAVQYALNNNKMLQELTIEELKNFSTLIESNIYDFITVESSVANRNSYGGTGKIAVVTQLENAKEFLQGKGNE